jgi:hypothetical protein
MVQHSSQRTVRPVHLWVFAVLLTLCMSVAFPVHGASTPQTYSLDIHGAPTAVALQALMRGGGKNYSLEPIKGMVTVQITHASFDQCLKALMNAATPPLAATITSGPMPGGVYNIQYADPHEANPGNALMTADTTLQSGDITASPIHRGASVTATVAKQLAERFCQRIGQPVSGPSKTTSAGASPENGFTYWQPCWKVNFPGQATLAVSTITGVIVSYNDDTQHWQPDTASSLSDITMTMPATAAIRLAKAALAATGQPEAANFNFATMSNLASWDISWERACQGISYQDASASWFENMGVTVNTRTGKIVSLGFNYQQAPVDPFKATVSPQQAITSAQAIVQGLKTANQEPPKLISANLRIARSADMAQFTQMIGIAKSTWQAQAVWIVRYLLTTVNGPQEQDIWIDAQTDHEILSRSFHAAGHFASGKSSS